MANPLLLDKRKGIVVIFLILVFQRSAHRLYSLVGQSLSALSATSLEYLSSCRRCHSLTETVNFAFLSLFGLIRSFHNISPDLVFIFSFFWLYRGSPHDNFLIIA